MTAFTEAVLEVINRLNFDTETFEAVINDKSEIIQETPVSSLSQAIAMEELPLDGYVKKIKRPRRYINLHTHFKEKTVFQSSYTQVGIVPI